MAKNILAPLFPTYPLCECLHLCFTIQTPRFLDCTPYRVYSVQGYEMLCWCYRSKTFTSVLNLLQHNENLDRLKKKRPSLSHTHTDLTVLESDGICMYVNSAGLSVLTIQWLFSCLWVVILFFSAGITDNGSGVGLFSAWRNVELWWRMKICFWYLSDAVDISAAKVWS